MSGVVHGVSVFDPTLFNCAVINNNIFQAQNALMLLLYLLREFKSQLCKMCSCVFCVM